MHSRGGCQDSKSGAELHLHADGVFLTRLGDDSRMIVTGDATQIDLRPGEVSGLVEATRILDGVESVSVIRFTGADVVRHPLVQRIVAAYEGDGRG